MKVRNCELSFCEKLQSTQVIMPSIGLTCSRHDKIRAFCGLIGKRIVLDYLSPGINTKDLGQLTIINEISKPVNSDKYYQKEDQCQEASSDDHHASLRIEFLINTFLCRIPYDYIDPADISSLWSVTVFFDLTLNISLESVWKAFKKSYSSTVRAAQKVEHDTAFAVAYRRC